MLMKAKAIKSKTQVYFRNIYIFNRENIYFQLANKEIMINKLI